MRVLTRRLVGQHRVGQHRKGTVRKPSLAKRAVVVCLNHGLMHDDCGIKVIWEG